MNEILTQEKSIYLQIAEMIETDILRDILLEEERVPSTNELAKLYAINPATAAKGVNILVDEGVLYKKRGIECIHCGQRGAAGGVLLGPGGLCPGGGRASRSHPGHRHRPADPGAKAGPVPLHGGGTGHSS